MEVIADHLIEIFFGLISAGALAFCKYLYGKNKKLEDMQQADQNRKYRQMILDEIEPIIAEISLLKANVSNITGAIEKEVNAVRTDMTDKYKTMYEDLNTIQQRNDKNFQIIVDSYKFRLIQLCKTHIRDGYITQPDFDQVSEMYRLYESLGGQEGQAKEYYDKVLELDIKKAS